jgi:hypothetical protein
MPKNKLLLFIPVLVMVGLYLFISNKSPYDKLCCHLKNKKIDGIVTGVYQSKEVVFSINSDSVLYPVHFMFRGDKFINYSGEDVFDKPHPGDHITKDANSGLIKFMRGNTTFIVKLNCSDCN